MRLGGLGSGFGAWGLLGVAGFQGFSALSAFAMSLHATLCALVPHFPAVRV